LRQTLRSSFVVILAAFFAGDVSAASTVVVGQGRWSVPASAPHHVGHPVLDGVRPPGEPF